MWFRFKRRKAPEPAARARPSAEDIAVAQFDAALAPASRARVPDTPKSVFSTRPSRRGTGL